MSVFRIVVNDKDTGKTITSTSKRTAYAELSASTGYNPNDKVLLQEVDDLFPVVGFMMVDLPPNSSDSLFPNH